MKVRKAIKKIAALGAGATMLGATLMGAMAADLSDYPDMFITDGQFDGLLVVGENADSIDTIGMTNIALGMQKAAVTKTLVCGADSASRTTVTGEQVQIEKTGDALNHGDTLAAVQDTELDDGDLPSILSDGEYDESEGENDNDVTYTQEIDVLAGTGTIVYDQDDQDAPEAGYYLLFDKNEDMYNYSLTFDDTVDYDASTSSLASDDLESTTIEIQGQSYTITDVTFSGSANTYVIDKMNMLVGESVLWIAQDETVTKEVDGVEHSITMVDVANVETDDGSCGFDVDGSVIWIDVDETETVSGVTIGVTEVREVHDVNFDQDICKVFLGAEELVLEHNQEVEIGGDEVDGSLVYFDSAASGGDGTWDGLWISYDPNNDEYLTDGDEFIDPVFGNFKFIMGGVVAVNEEITVEASGSDGTLTFINYDDDEVEIPFAMNESGSIFLGEDEDIVANPDEGFYLEGDACVHGGDITDCVGAKFLAVSSGSVAHVIELAAIDDPTNSDPEIDFDDLTTGTSTDNKDYTNGTGQTFNLGSGVGTITLDINANNITFDDIVLGSGKIKTSNEAVIVFVNSSKFTVLENEDEEVEGKIAIQFAQDATETDELNIMAPTFTCVGASCTDLFDANDKSDSDNDNQMYATEWGSVVEYDADSDTELTIWHPEEQLYVDVFVAELAAVTSTTEASEEGCTIATTQNPISSTVNKFDTEVSNPSAQNLVAVGGPCANSVTSALLGNPEVCYEGFEEGKSILQVFESGGNVAVIVAGGSGKDTRAASKVLQDYENYADDLSGAKVTVVTSSMRVEPFSDAAVEPEEEEEDMEDEGAEE